MISILRRPYPCSYSKNEVVFQAYSNMYFKSVYAYPTIVLTMNSLPTAGEHYVLYYTNPNSGNLENMRLVASASYDEYWEIPDNTFAGTMEQFTDVVLDKILNYRKFNGWYTVAKTDTQELTITAELPDDDLIPTWETNQSASRISEVIDTSNIDPEIRDGYQMKCLVYFEKSYLTGNFEVVADVECAMNESAETLVDVSEILDSEIERSWEEYPVPFEQENSYISPNLRRYYVEFIESWSGETIQQHQTSDIQFVHWGGVSVDDQHIADPVYLNSNSDNFLTWWPSGKKITKTQEDWLSWMNQGETQTIKVRMIVVTNGGTYQYTIHTKSLKTWESLTFNTGYAINNIDALVGGETVARWGFVILDNSNQVISPTFYYYPEINSCVYRTIMFFNSFGVPETFNTSGDWTENMNCSTSIARRSQNFNLTRLFPQSFVFNSKHQNSFKAISGVLNNEEALRLQPLLNSTISYLLDNSRWIPVLMNTGKTGLMKLNDFINRIEIEILKANSNDRASFYKVVPDILVNFDCGIDRFFVEDNGLTLSTYQDLNLYKNDTLLETISWNGGSKAYIPAATLTGKGHYRIEVEIDDYALTKHFDYSPERIEAVNNQTGSVGLRLRSSDAAATIDIDWGDGAGFVTENYTNVLTLITHNYTAGGKKKIILQKPCFDDIVEFNATNIELKGIDLSRMSNLKILALLGSVEGNVYLSQFKHLTNITLSNQEVYGVEIGFQKNLQVLSLSNIPMTIGAIDKLFLELWEYRKFYSNNPANPFVIMASLPALSALATSIKDGTGIYAGEGLETDYNWTFSIT